MKLKLASQNLKNIGFGPISSHNQDPANCGICSHTPVATAEGINYILHLRKVACTISEKRVFQGHQFTQEALSFPIFLLTLKQWLFLKMLARPLFTKGLYLTVKAGVCWEDRLLVHLRHNVQDGNLPRTSSKPPASLLTNTAMSRCGHCLTS